MESAGADERITVTNQLEKSVVGIVRATGVDSAHTDPEFDRELASLLAIRSDDLPPHLEAVRLESRNMLRNGVYKPTGRGKPASEYLLRATQDPASFPRVNWPVDVCNFISLKYLVPISIWDVDAAGSLDYLFRLGHPGEEYVFNAAGQVISLQDLAVGCSLSPNDGPDGTPIVNPVKDSMSTKTASTTRNVVAAVYAPVAARTTGLEEACAEFAAWLERATSTGLTSHMILNPGESTSC
jgi:DNA/RNA-binding domain of Phe-tRNA-synthetase-like protein